MTMLIAFLSTPCPSSISSLSSATVECVNRLQQTDSDKETMENNSFPLEVFGILCKFLLWTIFFGAICASKISYLVKDKP